MSVSVPVPVQYARDACMRSQNVIMDILTMTHGAWLYFSVREMHHRAYVDASKLAWNLEIQRKNIQKHVCGCVVMCGRRHCQPNHCLTIARIHSRNTRKIWWVWNRCVLIYLRMIMVAFTRVNHIGDFLFLSLSFCYS